MRQRRLAVWLALCFAVSTHGQLVKEFTVSEGAPPGTPVGYIGDELPDAPAPYTIVPAPNSHVHIDLHVDQNTGEIRTRSSLDRERRDSYSLIAIPTSGDNIRVLIRVLDENDNAPTFPSPFMRVDFSENTPRDVKRKLNPAKDLDVGIYNTQRYEILSGNADNAFRLSSHRERDGVLYLDLQINGVLDRETVDSYNLVIEALDGGTPPLRGNMTVNITILDVNDNPPIFAENIYSVTVAENATVGTFVLKVSAVDADAGENGQIEYSINRRQSDRSNIFGIDNKTGEITVNKPLDFETKELHELVVVARDRGMQPLETTCFVTIRVTDVNDNRPTIDVIFLSDDATPKISESAQKGEFIARISVHDPDSKTDYSNANVSLIGGDKKFELKTHDNIIYLVVASPNLDREEKPEYTLNILATDSGSPPLHAFREIKLRVTDINDNAPTFSENEYKAMVPEAATPGTVVLQISATDADEDENAEIRYSLASTPQSEWFAIDSRSGLVTTRARVDCETNSMPKLTVLATDSGKPSLSASASILITVLDVNDNEPVFDQSFYNVTVSENEAVGHCFLKVSAIDPDCGVNAIVNYTSGTAFGALKQFKISPYSGEICISDPLDYEQRNVYEIPVVATDRGGLFTTAVVKVQLIDVNDNAPEFSSPNYNVTLRTGRNFGSEPILTVSANDADSGRFGMVTYRLLSGDGESIFRVDRSGSVFVARPSMLRAGKKYYLEITATDGGGKGAIRNTVVHISILDSDSSMGSFHKPRYNFTVSEDAEPGTIVGALRPANLEGSTGAVHYSMLSGDPMDQFMIESTSGTIKTKKILDWEKKSSYLIAVAARSGNPPTFDHTQVAITVEDVNDNAPKFDAPVVRVSVSESSVKGAIIYSTRALDEDEGSSGKVRYSLDGFKNDLFEINSETGVVSLKGLLDHEESTRHSIVIKASDFGIPSLTGSATLIVDVQDANDNAPYFERAIYRVSIAESEPTGTEVAEVKAIDKDSGNNARLTYQISNFDGPFTIDSTSGRIYLTGILDRERQSSHSIVLAVHDNGVPQMSASTKVLIEITDSNDNAAVWSHNSYSMQVVEGLSPGIKVGRVIASDADIGDNSVLHYSILPPNQAFTINPSTGEIFTRMTLDREERSSYNLIVEARDQGTPSRASRVSVLIRVKDINDNAPEFLDPKEDVVSVREEQPRGTEVARLKAIDQDEGENASLTYTILEKDLEGFKAFSIDSITGVIKTNYVLNHDERSIFRLSVSASDKGQPPKQTIRQLRVEVLDLNDNRPTFTSSSLHFQVKENVKIGHVIGKVISCENAITENLIAGTFAKHISYTLVPLSMDIAPGTFEIDRRTGSLIVARHLDRESQDDYRLEVRVLDSSIANNPQSSAITIKIEVEDVNDNPPKWSEDPITFTVNEDTALGTSIFNFSAIDTDYASNADIFYKLINITPDKEYFSLDILTGNLYLVSNLDYESVSEFILTVRASNFFNNSGLYADVTVRVLINDCNDNAPVFVSADYINVALQSWWSTDIIYNVIAVDKDFDENGRVAYSIVGGNERGYFSLGYDTGRLSFSRDFANNIAEGRYLLNITAMDHGKPTQKQTNMLLTIDLKESSQSSSSYIEAFYKVNISEDVPIGSYVTTLKTQFNNKVLNNITFLIPSGIVDDTFSIDEHRGTVTTKKHLDREEKEIYSFPVYIIETTNMQSFYYDLTTVIVSVLDVNDNAPEFKKGSCYPLTVQENNKPGIIHTIAAKDKDIGLNGLVKYSITGGNLGNKFSIEAATGRLSSNVLDYENEQKYMLTISAQDHGIPSLQSSCNITIFVANQNDIDPVFELPIYTATIDEDILPDTSVLKVKTTFSNLLETSSIVYSIANETDWLFRIHNETGVLITAGPFDREMKSVYSFMIVATDIGGNYARSTKVPVEITVKDVNDNKPIFTKYPFYEKVPILSQPGQSLLRVTAVDNDNGINADILYELEDNHDQKFRINPTTGVLTNTQSLASESGKLIRLKVHAKDKGTPPQMSSGLIEIRIGEIPYNTPSLAFMNSSYTVRIAENTQNGKEIVQVTAIRSDGRRQRITYEIVNDEFSAFNVDEDTGVIRVLNSSQIDYEVNPVLKFTVLGRTEDHPILYSYCQVTVDLIDQNDNEPKFTQQEYSATILEGNSKGEYVMQFSAVDRDEGSNSQILYHIVDGNHDNAFVIEPAFAPVVRTNIVLDREIRDSYRLTVIATDAGVPQLTGSTTLRINVIDINDNKPTFPPRRIITVPEDTAPGTFVMSLTANDVDLYPALVYSIPHASDTFSIDRYSGKVVLIKPLDYETRKHYVLNITASDSKHLTETALTIKISDVNDNSPIFEQISYHFNLPVGSGVIEIGAVKATDNDSGDNSKISYNFLYHEKGYIIEEQTGKIYANFSQISLKRKDVQLVVVAKDKGKKPNSVVCAVHLTTGSKSKSKSFSGQDVYRITVYEDEELGKSLLQIGKSSEGSSDWNLYISSGNDDFIFDITASGALILLKKLDRETKDTYILYLNAREHRNIFTQNSNASAITVFITVADVNDNYPIFNSTSFEFKISELFPIGQSIAKITAYDNDLKSSENAMVTYTITSGDDQSYFYIHPDTGVLSVNKSLDYDSGKPDINVIVKACDKGKVSLCNLQSIKIVLLDENDNAPLFPVSEYYENVAENERIGTSVFIVRATDLDRGVFGKLNYSITAASPSEFTTSDDSWQKFSIDAITGLVTTNTIFDYEIRNKYTFSVAATDAGGKSTSVQVKIEIESRDEYYPQFTQKTYNFVIAPPTSSYLPAGYVVGQVTATDHDQGVDGKVVYQLSTTHSLFKINRSTGVITLKKRLEDYAVLSEKESVSLVITASSGQAGSLTNKTAVEITLDPLAINSDDLDSTTSAANNGISDWALGLIIALLLIIMSFGGIFLFLHMKNKRHKKINKPGLTSEGVGNSNSYVDPSAFDTIPIRGNGEASLNSGQFAPPKYDEIPPYGPHAPSSNSGAPPTSELTGSDRSGSSGRGSAEDGDEGEDEEIRAINERPHRREITEDDNLSDVSVHNTQEYLARLGIVETAGSGTDERIPRRAYRDDADLTNLIYAKLNDVTCGSDRASEADEVGVVVERAVAFGGFSANPGEPVTTRGPSMTGSLSSIVHSEEELTGSYNWDYLLDWGPRYQPLAHVFSEIARLKDDAASTRSGDSSRGGANSTRSAPPPLITAVAAMRCVVPSLGALSEPVTPFTAAAAMCPSFSPSLSPLANRSPSISPLVAPGLPGMISRHKQMSQHTIQDATLRI